MSELVFPSDAIADLDPNDQPREVFARYGLAMYEAQVLEHGVVNALTVIEFVPRANEFGSLEIWNNRFDAFLDEQFDFTFGNLVRRLIATNFLSNLLTEDLKAAKDLRDNLAHRFFRNFAEDFLTIAGSQKMVDFCDDSVRRFHTIDKALDAEMRPLRERLGLTDDWIAARMAEDAARLGVEWAK